MFKDLGKGSVGGCKELKYLPQAFLPGGWVGWIHLYHLYHSALEQISLFKTCLEA